MSKHLATVEEDEDPEDLTKTCYVCSDCWEVIEACDKCNKAFVYGDEIYCHNGKHFCKECGGDLSD